MSDDYFDALADYYNNSRQPSAPGAAAGFREELARPGSWVPHLVTGLRAVVRGRRVLEVACGMGKWTQLAADAAEEVVATDISANLLENARGLPLPGNNVSFVQCDAFDVRTLGGGFGAGLHMNFINHLPLAQVPRFLDGFHEVLGAGAAVFCGAQKFRGDAEEPVYERRGTGDTVSLGRHDDGRPLEVVDTLFSEDLLRGLLAGRAGRLDFSQNGHWWWLSYQVA